MSTWLDLDKSDDESLSSTNEGENEYDDVMDTLTNNMNDLNTMTHSNPSMDPKLNKFRVIRNKSKSMTLPTSFRPAPSYGAKRKQDEESSIPPSTDHEHDPESDNRVKRTYSYPLPDTEPFCVWLGNLPAEAKPSDIVAYLEPLKVQPRDIRFGRIHKNKYTCAYVDFYNKEDMKKSLQSIDCSAAPLFMGRQVEIDINEGIVVDREAAVTCTSSSNALNSPFRAQSKSSSSSAIKSKQDVRFSNKQDVRKQKQKQKHIRKQKEEDILSSPQMLSSSSVNDYYAEKRERYQQNNVFRGRRGRGGRIGRDRNYFRGQYGHYRQKNGNKGAYLSHSTSSPTFPTKPIKILQRPKQNKVTPIVAIGSNSGKTVNKSRFPTLDEDHNNSKSKIKGLKAKKNQENEIAEEYIGNHNDNNKYFNNFNSNNNYYQKTSKRHINNNTFNQNISNQQQNNEYDRGYKQKRHRNRSHSDRDHDYYSNPYKSSYRDSRNDNYYNSNKSYSKKRHNYGY